MNPRAWLAVLMTLVPIHFQPLARIPCVSPGLLPLCTFVMLIAGLTQPMLLFFAAIDQGGAVWTAPALPSNEVSS